MAAKAVKGNRMKKRQRTDSASDAPAAAAGGGDDDPRARLAAFHARMFDVGVVSSTRSADASAATLAPVAEDDAVPQLAPLKRSALAKRHKAAAAVDDDEMPRVIVKTAKVRKAATKTVTHASGSPLKLKEKKATNETAASVVAVAPAAADKHFEKKKMTMRGKKEKKKDALANAGGAEEPSRRLAAPSSTPAAAVPGVVTQEQLAMFSDLVSLEEADDEDPLESAMKAAKAQMAPVDSPARKRKKNAKSRKATKTKSEKLSAQHEEEEDGDAVNSRPAEEDDDDVGQKVETMGLAMSSPASQRRAARAVVVTETGDMKSEGVPALQDSEEDAEEKTKVWKRKIARDRVRGMSFDLNSVGLDKAADTNDASRKMKRKSETAETALTEASVDRLKKVKKAKEPMSGLASAPDAHEPGAPTISSPAVRMPGNESAIDRAALSPKTLKHDAIVARISKGQKKVTAQPVVEAAAATKVKKKKNEASDVAVAPDLSTTASSMRSTKELLDDRSGEESGDELDAAMFSPERIFSNLIDEAARQQWELLEVGRLVKLFAGQWGQKKKRTTRFLCEFCPELVNVDFLEGLGINLRPKQLVKIFECGSGSGAVLMNKLASALENGNLTVRDPAFIKCISKRVQHMATNHEVLEFLVPLLESLSTVRDVSQLLKHVCQGWHLERSASLVQQILLTAVFDDLDGNQDEILKDLPELAGKLDFPSRLDQEDADENGNLIGLIANEGSDLGEESGASDDEAEEALGEIESEDEELRASDEDDDDESYEGETDSEEERAIRAQQRPKRRSRFILDEADEESEGHESDDLETEDEHSEAESKDNLVSEESSSESESDSEDESWRSKPKATAKH